MDRRLILAVAGSGKTTYLINSIDPSKRYLIVTYTENNLSHIRRRIVDRFGFLPDNVNLLSYFQFLFRVCYRPFLKDKFNAKGITWNLPEDWTRFKTGAEHYLSSGRNLYHNRLAKLCLNKCAPQIKERIEKYYDCFLIDEVQDLGGHDFNLMLAIVPTKIDCLFVGDFFQHTYDTSLDGNVRKSLYGDYRKYKREWSNIGITVDEMTLSNSYRCSSTLCDFVRNSLLIDIRSHRDDETLIVYVDNQEEADVLYNDNTTIKLFYQDSSKYVCYSENWGKSKGLDNFTDVCIVLNATTLKAYRKNALSTLAAPTLNKLYVACTRARRNVYLIPHTYIDRYKRK